MILLALLILLVGGTAIAQVTQPEVLEEAVQFIPLIIEAISNGQWLAVGAMVTIVVTFAFKKYVLPSLGLGKGILPIVAAAVGVISGAGLAVLNNAEPVPALLAVLSGPVAITLYDALVKYFFAED